MAKDPVLMREFTQSFSFAGDPSKAGLNLVPSTQSSGRYTHAPDAFVITII